jgi:hypothetical protein
MTTKAEKEYMRRAAELGCALAWFKHKQFMPADIHHLRTGVGAGRRSGHMNSIPLSPHYHRLSNEAIHVMGRKAWEKHHGVTEVELLEQTKERLGIAVE